MTGNPISCGDPVLSTLKEILTDTVTANLVVLITTSSLRPLTSARVFHTPPLFGGSRTKMINTTSISQQLYPTIAASHVVIGSTVGPTLSQTGTSTTSEASNIAKLSSYPYTSWYHVLFWVVVMEIMTSFLWIRSFKVLYYRVVVVDRIISSIVLCFCTGDTTTGSMTASLPVIGIISKPSVVTLKWSDGDSASDRQKLYSVATAFPFRLSLKYIQNILRCLCKGRDCQQEAQVFLINLRRAISGSSILSYTEQGQRAEPASVKNREHRKWSQGQIS